MLDRISILAQYLLPKQALTVLAGRFAAWRGGKLTTGVVRWFVRRYGVNMSEAANTDIESYRTFNEFFVRALRDGLRPLSKADLVCPVDGAISQFGDIDGDGIHQAKGHRYTTTALLGGDPQLASHFRGGNFATIYLSPKDYHRIHMPCDGRLTRMIHVPGSLFSVNPLTVSGVPNLFARNERVVCMFETPHGPLALVLVGATIVGSMSTVWHGVVNPPRPRGIREWLYEDREILLRQGDEMGRFQLGSTVVVLVAGDLRFSAKWAPAHTVRLGEEMAMLVASERPTPQQRHTPAASTRVDGGE